MIHNKEDLIEYLEEDRKALKKEKLRPSFFGDEIWKFQIYLRKYEYYLNHNSGGGCARILQAYYRLKWHNLGVKLGFSVPPNVFGKGLSIAHYGLLTVNGDAKVGDYCRILEGVNIGATADGCPYIGSNVFIGSGAKIIGRVDIASHSVIGAGAVVVKDIKEEYTTWAGVPAKMIGYNTR